MGSLGSLGYVEGWIDFASLKAPNVRHLEKKKTGYSRERVHGHYKNLKIPFDFPQ
jgi:hypothetical protein